MQNRTASLQDLVMIGLCAAMIAVLAQLSIPMPTGVPMTMQTFAVTLVAVLLGARRGALAAVVYVLLGAVGVPVFAEFSGGLHFLVSPTGGFLWSFPLMAFLIGLGAERFGRSKAAFVFWLVLGTALNYVVGVFVFCLVTDSSVMAGIAACVIPFLPTAVIKAILASALGLKMRERLVRTAWI